MKKNRKGFTLIELLVVIAIIGLLSTLAIVSLNTARAKSRDTKRTADLRTIQSAIELCINEGGMPPNTTGTTAGVVPATWAGMSTALCSSTTGNLGTYLASGTMPTPPSGGSNVVCGVGGVWDVNVPQNCYTYCYTAGGSSYLLAGATENIQTGGSTTNAAYAIGACVNVSSAGATGANTVAFAANDCGAAGTHVFCLGK